MLTHSELCKLLEEHYTSEELVDMLDIPPRGIVRGWTSYIEDNFEMLLQRVQEDTGYGLEEGDMI
jgi:hypothetical protein